jgi:CRISPR-associated Csx14 family protein
LRRKAKAQVYALVATIGVEPQVVTLTLDALRERGFPIACVCVLHPNDRNPDIANAIQRLRKEQNFYRDLRWLFIPIREGEHYPEDFATEQDVALLLRVIYRTVNRLKRKGYRIHLSIAGGRKVMTAMGMVVAQLLLDEHDHVWHLLSEGKLLQSKAMHAQRSDKVALVPVPVLRWSLLPSTVQEILIWDDPYRAIERQRQLQQHQRWQLLNSFWQKLTSAEREVVKALVQHGGKAEVLAKRLNRSPKTVRNQLQSVYAKYRDHFDLPADTRVRERLIADLAPVLPSLDEGEAR